MGLLTGLVQYGWILGHSAVVHADPAEQAWARRELEWWVPARAAGAVDLVAGRRTTLGAGMGKFEPPSARREAR